MNWTAAACCWLMRSTCCQRKHFIFFHHHNFFSVRFLSFKRAHVELKCVRCNEYSSIFVPSFYRFFPPTYLFSLCVYVYLRSSQNDWHLFWCFQWIFFYFPPLLKLEKNAAHWQPMGGMRRVFLNTNISFRLKFRCFSMNLVRYIIIIIYIFGWKMKMKREILKCFAMLEFHQLNLSLPARSFSFINCFTPLLTMMSCHVMLPIF